MPLHPLQHHDWLGFAVTHRRNFSIRFRSFKALALCKKWHQLQESTRLASQITIDLPIIVQFCFLKMCFVYRFIKSFLLLPAVLTLASVLLQGMPVRFRPAI